MLVARTAADMRSLRQNMPGTVGLVPTMGYLHEGHLVLARQARDENSSTVVSIFVNPTQFGPSEDFTRYPRNIERDLAMLKGEDVDIVFMPEPADVYPAGFNTWVEVKGVTEGLEGVSRPGHFRGVATVVAKLFNLVQPTRAYFGQKDAQQVVVVKKMVADLNMNLEVVVVPTVRESDGLAMSSRNTYLSSQERQAAAVLYRALRSAEARCKSGVKDAEALRREMREIISRESVARTDYISIADAQTLEELTTLDRPAVASMAVWIGKTRLIDNMALG